MNILYGGNIINFVIFVRSIKVFILVWLDFINYPAKIFSVSFLQVNSIPVFNLFHIFALKISKGTA
jgi:hypothetical protein